MPKSIRTTSNTQITTNSTLATFKASDSVLCPSVGNGTYKLFNDKEYDCLGFTLNGKTYHYRNDGKVSRDDKAPSLFYDTPANRQAINTLYGSQHQIKTIGQTVKRHGGVSIQLSNQRTNRIVVIDGLHDRALFN